MNQASKRIAENIKPNTIEELQLKTLCMRRDEVNRQHNFTTSWQLYRKFLLQVYKSNVKINKFDISYLFRCHNHVMRCWLCVNLVIN